MYHTLPNLLGFSAVLFPSVCILFSAIAIKNGCLPLKSLLAKMVRSPL